MAVTGPSIISDGGTNTKDAVKRIQGNLLEHQLSLQYNWAGKKGPKVEGTQKQASVLRVAAAVESKKNMANIEITFI